MNQFGSKKNNYGFQWMITGPSQYQFCGETVTQLPAGAYTCTLDPYGREIYHFRNLLIDSLINVEGSLPDRILKEINQFWSCGSRFAKYGFLHRRGYLLYGKQGGGKSSLIHQIIQGIIRQGHVAFFCDYPRAFTQCVEKFREVEPSRPVLCVFEDIDSIIENYGESELLQWLDGNHQINKAVNLATTNYPEKLDPRIHSRPRRFDRILRIESPDTNIRRAYFTEKVKDLTNEELTQWVQLSEGLSFASLAELVISVCCLGNDIHDTATLLRNLEEQKPNSNTIWPTEFDANGEANKVMNEETNGELTEEANGELVSN